jgi:AraC family transcriptional regulator
VSVKFRCSGLSELSNAIWQVRRVIIEACSEVQLDAGAVRLGGPQAASHPEHEHPETQITIHIPVRPDGELNPGSGCASIIPGSAPHAGGWPDNTFSLVFHLSPELLLAAGDEVQAHHKCDVIGGNVADPFLLHLGSIVIREMRSGHNGRLFLDSGKHVLAGWIIRRYSQTVPRSANAEALLTNRQLCVLREFIETRFDRPPTVTELAAVVGSSPQRFSRMLRATVGLGPHAFLTHLRVERAKRLLAYSRLDLSEIAFKLGFASQSHFGAVFRRAMDTTPMSYRKQMLGRRELAR